MMRRHPIRMALALLGMTSGLTMAAPSPKADTGAHLPPEQAAMLALAKPTTSTSSGSVSVEGKRIQYTAKAGTIVLHGSGEEANTPTVSMFYVAYFKKGADAAKRPVTFVYNGGPGSSSMWLHMGAFGPHRVVTKDDTHTPAAPYRLTNNDYSLLDATDLVFIDAPGTGFSRLIAEAGSKDARETLMKKREKHFYSVDGDAHAFAAFIADFLSQYGRWNSPKYLFGESYGTTRSAVLSNILTNEDSIDLNGVVLLSQILNFDTSIDGPERNPGVDLPYELALPTFAATAWYHHKLPERPAQLKPFLAEVEQFAGGAYAQALMQGSALPDAQRQAIAEKLHRYTGLPTAYWLKADLRVNGGQFEKNLLGDSDDSTGRLDSRFSGPSIDPLSESSEYDPQSSAISSAYVSLFNDYVRKDLKFGQDRHYRLYADIDHWDFKHHEPGVGGGFQATTNVLPDLAMAMKTNPDMKVFLNGGYYDLATPFYAAIYEMHHLPIPERLDKNISYAFYPSGHMVYAHVPALKKLHDNVVRFIESTDNLH